ADTIPIATSRRSEGTRISCSVSGSSAPIGPLPAPQLLTAIRLVGAAKTSRNPSSPQHESLFQTLHNEKAACIAILARADAHRGYRFSFDPGERNCLDLRTIHV